MEIRIQPLYLASVIAVWIIFYNVVYGVVAIARDRSLVFWSVGPFGVTVASLREPPARRILAQLGAAALALTVLVYINLFLIVPPPITGLNPNLTSRLVAVVIPVILLTAGRAFALLREHIHPIWGEARVLARAQRSLATGARIYFTQAGRAFLHDRFGTTPNEFLRMVR
ncbi:MAG: hypothetical protein ACLQUY_14790 [Ktedonobacterales bacterium]